MKNKKSFIAWFKFFIFIYIMLIANIAFLDSAEEVKNLPTLMKSLSKEKAIAEEFVSMLKDDKAQINNHYNKARVLYILAEGEFNGWIEEIKWAFENNPDYFTSRDYRVSSEKARGKSKEFIDYVMSLYSKNNPKGLKRKGIPNFDIKLDLADLIDLGKYIWEQYNKSDETKKEQIKEQLNNIKWQPFDKINMKISSYFIENRGAVSKSFKIIEISEKNKSLVLL